MKSPSREEQPQSQQSISQQIARRLVASRRSGRALPGFPGSVPGNLDDAYQIQDIAIALWNEPIGGWKVGRIPLDLEDQFGIDRLAGPVFASTIHEADDDTIVDMPVFVGGFAAIEAEFVAVIGTDAAADKVDWTLDEASAIIADLRIGLEIASSPLPAINDLGPAGVASDFGNNFGLVVGPSIESWQSRALESMRSSSSIDGQVVGDGGAFKLTGGFVRSVQFLLQLAARRGFPLRAGDVIATGQTTGIHEIAVGEIGTTNFGDDGEISIRAVAAQPF